MSKNISKKTCSPADGVFQAYLEVEYKGADAVGSMPKVVLRDASLDSHPANLILLKGVVTDMEGSKDPWKVGSTIADMCRAGAENEADVPKRNALREHLAYAYCILGDYLREFDGDFLMSKETAETLIRGAMDRLSMAGSCAGIDLDSYRSED